MSKPIQVTRRLEFDAGHRLVGHESKCRYLHGHHYCAEITVQGPQLDGCGRVVDFSVLKQRVGSWIDEQWDHNMILNQLDPLLRLTETEIGVPDVLEICGQEPYIMNRNPTAENMVQELAIYAEICLRGCEIQLVKIRLYETPNCWADWYADNQ